MPEKGGWLRSRRKVHKIEAMLEENSSGKKPILPGLEPTLNPRPKVESTKFEETVPSPKRIVTSSADPAEEAMEASRERTEQAAPEE